MGLERTPRKRNYRQYKRPGNLTPEERQEDIDPVMPLSFKDRRELIPQMPGLVQKMVARGLMKFPDPNNEERTE